MESPGSGIHRIVDENYITLLWMCQILRHCGCDMERTPVCILLDIRPVLLWDGKVDIDRIRLIDDNDGHIGGLDEISGFHHHRAGAAVNWRVDRAIAQLQLRASERVLVDNKNGADVLDRGTVRAHRFLQCTGL